MAWVLELDIKEWTEHLPSRSHPSSRACFMFGRGNFIRAFTHSSRRDMLSKMQNDFHKAARFWALRAASVSMTFRASSSSRIPAISRRRSFMSLALARRRWWRSGSSSCSSSLRPPLCPLLFHLHFRRSSAAITPGGCAGRNQPLLALQRFP